MKRFTLFTMFAALVLASTSAADLPPPPGIVEVTPRVRLVGTDKYPDYVFYLSFKTSRGNPNVGTQLRFEMKNADAVTLKGCERRIANMFVLAVGRKEFETRKAEDASLAWLTEKGTGILSAAIVPPPTYGNVKDKEVPVTEYTVSIADGKLKAATVAAPKRTTELGPEERPLRPWVVGIACALSLALFRRLVRSAAAPAA